MTLHLIARDLRIAFKDRGALLLGFAVPIVLFTVFVLIFGGMGSSGDIDPIRLIVVDEDGSSQSRRLVGLLDDMEPIRVVTDHPGEESDARVSYTAESAREAVAGGTVTNALVIPHGLSEAIGRHLFSEPDSLPALTLFYDAAVPMEAQVVQGLLQQALFMSFTDAWAVRGIDIMGEQLGISRETTGRMQSYMTDVFNQIENPQGGGAPSDSSGSAASFGPPIPVRTVDVLGESKRSPIAALTAAQVVVMFLLFSVTFSASAILREQETGTLRRLLVSPMTDWQFLLGKMGSTAVFGFVQILIMFLYGWAVFHVDLFRDFPAVLLMTAVCAFCATSIGLLVASLCRSYRQVDSVATLVVLSMSAVGGSMIPRFLMPKWMQNIGLVSFNAWAIDGFYKIFWREMGVAQILPQVGVLVAAGTLFFFIASHLFRRRFYT